MRRKPVLGTVLLSIVVVAAAAPPVLAGEADERTVAEGAIADLTASMPPTMVPVQGGGMYAPGPECDGVRSADALAAEGETVEQAYGGEPGGAFARITILDSKQDAKRYFKLITNDDAEACVVATTELGMSPISGGAPASADLERGKVRRVKGSVLLDGTITLGEIVSHEHRPTVRRDNVVIQANAGELGTSAAGLGEIVQAWFVETARRF